MAKNESKDAIIKQKDMIGVCLMDLIITKKVGNEQVRKFMFC